MCIKDFIRNSHVDPESDADVWLGVLYSFFLNYYGEKLQKKENRKKKKKRGSQKVAEKIHTQHTKVNYLN